MTTPPPTFTALEAAANRLGCAHMHKLAEECGPYSPTGYWAGRLANSGVIPPGLLEPLVRIVATLVLTLLAAKCGRTYQRAAAWLASRPVLGFRGLRIRRAVREAWFDQDYDAKRAWNPDLLAEAADGLARGLTAADLELLHPEARAKLPGWTPPSGEDGCRM